MRIAIIGGVAGGASAATRARRLDEHAEIVIFEKGPYVSYANCGLPYYVGGQISSTQDLLLETPESLWDRFRIRVHVNTEVIDIHPRSGQLRYVQANSTYEDHFDRFILAPGASSILPNVRGIDRMDVFSLRTVPDAVRLREYLDLHLVRHAAIIGAGFIGLEMAEVLHSLGIEVTLVDQASHVLPPVDLDMARALEALLPTLGIHLALSSPFTGVHGKLGHPIVDIASGARLAADVVIVGLGVRPSLSLAKSIGLKLGPTGAIRVDHHMKTSEERIWAAGDAVEKWDLATNKPRWWPLAGVANKEGRVAGTNAAGGDATLPGALGTGIVRLSPYVIGMTGLTEKVATREHIPYETLHTLRGNHAGYYPGSTDILLKLLYDPHTGRVLGAQALGETGVDKRIDVMATAIQGRMTVDDLANLDLAYAPPIGAAKDPIVITGMSAVNRHQGLIQSISVDSLSEWLKSSNPPIVLDVRDPDEVQESGGIEGAQHIPLNELRERLHEIPSGQTVVACCRSGHRSYLATRILSQNGWSRVFNLDGGLTVWNLTHSLTHSQISS